MTFPPTWLEINLANIENNTRRVLATAGVPLIAVVKANAYGLGAVEVSRAVLSAGASMLAVARFGEARTLREAGIGAPILVLGYVTPEEVDEAIGSGVTLNLYSAEMAEIYTQRAAALGQPVRVHLKVDTGLHRLGFDPAEAPEAVRRVLARGGIEIEGVFSHFAMSDDGDYPETREQIRRFTEALAALQVAGVRPRWTHLAGSSGLYYEPGARFNMVRAGATLFGLPPRGGAPLPAGLRPTITWKARLGSTKVVPAGQGIGYGHTYRPAVDELIGVLAVGYSDGIRRVNHNEVLIGGRKAPVVGKICMDMTMVRLPHAFPAGTEAVLLGRQGGAEITIEDLMTRWKAAVVEVTSAITARVERIYIRD